MDVIIATYVTILSFAFIPLSKSQRFSELFGFSAGSVGLVLSTAQHMLGLFQWGIRQLLETENQLTSVERLLEYAKLEPEPSLGQGFLDDEHGCFSFAISWESIKQPMMISNQKSSSIERMQETNSIPFYMMTS